MSDDSSKPQGDIRPLEYRGRDDDRSSIFITVATVGCAGVLGLGAALACAFVWLIANIYNPMIYPPGTPTPLNWVVPLSITLAIFGILITLAAGQYFRWKEKSFFIGLLIGTLLGAVAIAGFFLSD